jgi:hypothetical protein
MCRKVLVATMFVLLGCAVAQAGFVSGTFNCDFPDEPLPLVKHNWNFNYTDSMLTLHEGAISALGNDSVNISGVTTEDPIFWISEDVTNTTGYDWTSYTLTLPPAGVNTFVNDWFTTSDHYAAATFSPDNRQLTFSSGLVPDGETVQFNFKINVPTTGSFNFCLTQTPVPEPSSLALLAGAALAGIAVAVRRRARG